MRRKRKVWFDSSKKTYAVLVKEFCPDVKFRWCIEISGFETKQAAEKHIASLRR